MIRRLVMTLAALLLTATALTGCERPLPPPSDPLPVQTPDKLPAADLKRMSPEQKRSEIASTFPAEVPVPVGDVKSGEAQGEGVWDYAVSLDGEPAAVAAWYSAAYGHAEWQIVDSSHAGTTFELSVRKGRSESKVTVERTAEGRSLATVVVGVGAQILRTQ